MQFHVMPPAQKTNDQRPRVIVVMRLNLLVAAHFARMRNEIAAQDCRRYGLPRPNLVLVIDAKSSSAVVGAHSFKPPPPRPTSGFSRPVSVLGPCVPLPHVLAVAALPALIATACPRATHQKGKSTSRAGSARASNQRISESANSGVNSDNPFTL